jgi:regulator of protease activity HflC (stomatin/prohibitin superfamily)
MVLIIITVVLILATAFGLGLDLENDEWKPRKRMLFSLIWLVLILFGCFTNIGANKVGIVYNPLKGGIQNYTLTQGYKTKSPFTKIYKINTEVEELTFENISVQTGDSQYVNTVIKAQVKINSNKAFEYFSKYRDKSLEDISSLLSATIQKQLESITIQYNIMELLGSKRDEIVNKSLELIKAELSKDGIEVLRLTLVDTDAGNDVEKAIANEAVAKKEAETAEYKKQKAQLEGEAKVIEAQKEKEANELISRTLTKELLTEKFIEKWSGNMPYVVGSDGMMIDIDSLLGDK